MAEKYRQVSSGHAPTGVALLVLALVLSGCSRQSAHDEPVIEFSKLPHAGEGSPDKLDGIEGRVKGAQPGQQVVLFARSGIWWVQPTAADPFTKIAADSTWKNMSHPGSAYAALLVDAGYRPPATLKQLPEKGASVLAVATAEGAALKRPPPKTVHFSGYQWEIREVGSDRGGTRNLYSADNVWTDDQGFLHLRIAGRPGAWTSAEVTLSRSLGYGSYHVVARDVSTLEPAAVFSIFTWDDSGPPREMDIEISRWGELASKNGQFLIQPYYVPANVIRFNTGSGTRNYSLLWEPGRASFQTATAKGSETIAEHVFTSGIPTPGNEAVHMNLYVFDNKSNPLQHGCEVVIEKFEYLP